MSGSSPQSELATKAEEQQLSNITKLFQVAFPLENNILNYEKGAIKIGEPDYAKKGFAEYGANIRAQSDATTRGQISRAGSLVGSGSAQGLGQISNTLGGGRTASALTDVALGEGQTMFKFTNSLMDLMAGGAGQALSASTSAGALEAGAISKMQNFNSTQSDVLAGLSAAASIYGAYNKYNQANAWSGVSTGAVQGPTTSSGLPYGTQYSDGT